MPIDTPRTHELFVEDFKIVGKYRTDALMVPHYNPIDSGKLILPGEPIIKLWGGTDEKVFLAQGEIWPGKVGMLLAEYTADFPCILSADVAQGTYLYWDIDVATDDHPVGVAKLAGDVTNGFVIGVATFAMDDAKNNHNGTMGVSYDVDANDRVICGTSTSTRIRVTSLDGVAITKGTVTAMGVQGSSAGEMSALEKRGFKSKDSHASEIQARSSSS